MKNATLYHLEHSGIYGIALLELNESGSGSLILLSFDTILLAYHQKRLYLQTPAMANHLC